MMHTCGKVRRRFTWFDANFTYVRTYLLKNFPTSFRTRCCVLIGLQRLHLGRKVVKWHCYSGKFTCFTCCQFRTVPYHTQHDTYSNCYSTNVGKTVSLLFASEKMLFHLSGRTSVLVIQHLGTHTYKQYSGCSALMASRKHRCKDEGVDSNN